MSENIEVSRLIPARPERVFNAWLDADEHSLMTSGEAATVAPDGSFTAFDGYISGRTLDTAPHSRIVQTWLTTEFPDGSPDSRLEVTFVPEGDGTKLTLK
ncbi:MAG: SRPBCC domain-containing protein, partial [Myxococcaceae bacterium]|nr:SRPBCC domain-containing protein [Myxococcaceae bacterium]